MCCSVNLILSTFWYNNKSNKQLTKRINWHIIISLNLWKDISNSAHKLFFIFYKWECWKARKIIWISLLSSVSQFKNRTMSRTLTNYVPLMKIWKLAESGFHLFTTAGKSKLNIDLCNIFKFLFAIRDLLEKEENLNLQNKLLLLNNKSELSVCAQEFGPRMRLIMRIFGNPLKKFILKW